jgi:DNA-binding HxlR family transcriptional regulator
VIVRVRVIGRSWVSCFSQPTLDESVSKCNYVDVAADWTRENCAVGNTLAVVGERWTLLVLRECFLGVRRFEQIQRNTGVARNILTDRLNTLVLHGVLRRDLYQERPERYEYRLTEKGLDLYPILLTLMAWGAKHGGGRPITLTHTSCGATALPHLACPECGERVEARDMRAVREEAPAA